MVVLASMGVAVLNMPAHSLDAWDDAWLNPPLSASPGCYYYWDTGNISKYGITKDLEAMKAIGIDEPFVANVVGKRAKQGLVKVFTEEWWDCMVHAANEAKRLGMHIGYFDYTVVDAQGNICPDVVKLDFEVKGQGSNAGVANDDMMSDEPWQGNSRSTYRGKCQLIVRSNALAAVSGKNRKIGKIVVKAKSKGLKPLTTIITVK